MKFQWEERKKHKINWFLFSYMSQKKKKKVKIARRTHRIISQKYLYSSSLDTRLFLRCISNVSIGWNNAGSGCDSVLLLLLLVC